MTAVTLSWEIPPLDEAARAAVLARQDRLTKPRGSLGRLETLSAALAAMQGTPQPRLRHKGVLVMAGDHGVTAAGVSAYPSEVTAQMVLNFVRGGAAISVLARQMGARLRVVDVGVAAEIPPHPHIYARKVRAGTANMLTEPAMRLDEARAALAVGAEVVAAEHAQGLDVLALGDMGIGNTTAAAALAAVFTGRSPAELVGRGTGLDDEGLQRKIRVVEAVLARHRPQAQAPLDTLAAVGGLEIAALAGAMLAAAERRIPVLLDGYIVTAAALVAVALQPRVRDYLIAAHASAETGHRWMLAFLGLEPLLRLDLRLGEGTGAVLALPLLEAAVRLLQEMATFDEAGVSERNAS